MNPWYKPQYLQYVYHLLLLKSLPGAQCTPMTPLQFELWCMDYYMVSQHKGKGNGCLFSLTFHSMSA